MILPIANIVGLRQEGVGHLLREENERLKQLVAELSLVNLTLKKGPFGGRVNGGGVRA